MKPGILRAIPVAAALGAMAAAAPAAPVTVKPVKVPARACTAVQVRPGAFNAPGNIVIGWVGEERGEDGLVEMTAAGATVWECRTRPGGTLLGFRRAPDGSTLVAQWTPGRLSRVLVIAPGGDVRAACQLSLPEPSPPPAVTGLAALPGGGVFISTAGWAASLTRRWRIEREMLHRNLKSAAPLSDGRWLVAFHDPERFAVYDPGTRSLSPVPIEALCHLWEAARGEEISPGRWRFYGCFCIPQPAQPGQVMPRKTMEVVDTDASGAFLWAWGSRYAIRVEEFGTQRCATFTREVVSLPGDHLLVLDGYPADCRVAELDAAGEPVRIYMTGPSTEMPSSRPRGTFGENACGLVGLQVLEAAPPR